jgi:hypothetical protein
MSVYVANRLIYGAVLAVFLLGRYVMRTIVATLLFCGGFMLAQPSLAGIVQGGQRPLKQEPHAISVSEQPSAQLAGIVQGGQRPLIQVA